MISRKTVLYASFLLCISICFHAGISDPLIKTCSDDAVYNVNSTNGREYRDNLETLLNTLYSNATTPTGFSGSTAGTANATVYGLFLCRGDLSPSKCQTCLTTATYEALTTTGCPNQTRDNIYYINCMLRYSDQPIFSKLNVEDGHNLSNSIKLPYGALFDKVMSDTFDAVATTAVNDPDFRGKKFVVQETYVHSKFSDFENMYTLAQCTPDISNVDCNNCLRRAISDILVCCSNSRGAIVIYPSCNIRYEMYPFYQAPDPGNNQVALSVGVVVAIALSIASGIVLLIIGFFLSKRRSIKTNYSSRRLDESDEDDIAVDPESLHYRLSEIETATNDFSAEYKIGQGGFGSVYKGILRNRQEIAVKRLSKSSGQGAAEFKNEIAVVAKLQHRNLVRLLGFCLEGNEKILVYEFVPRRSLDYFLFDPEKQLLLNWSRRRNIIGGIARGLLYLHEDSHLKIVHRDLKAGNILLDESMHPKIADFGMAKICGIHDSEGNTNKIAGTLSGLYSVKSDVFSFGVVMLEIISGKKNSSFYQSEVSKDLINYAWRQWRDDTPLARLDPTIGDSYVSTEVTQCIHISLLCVEEDANKRPTMASVVYMLNSTSVNLPIPHHPLILRNDRLEIPLKQSRELLLESINEISFTESYPR